MTPAGYPDAESASGEEPAAGEHLPACPVLTDPRSSDLDCRCWPWTDALLAAADIEDTAAQIRSIAARPIDAHVVDWHDQDRCWACSCGFTSRAQHNTRRHADAANAAQHQGDGW